MPIPTTDTRTAAIFCAALMAMWLGIQVAGPDALGISPVAYRKLSHASVAVLTPSGSQQSTLHAPAMLQTPSQGSLLNACFFGPGDKRHGSSRECQQMVPPRISTLLSWRSPSAVLARVGTVVVDAINAVLRRGARPHVGIEVLKGLPPLADGDAATAVPRKFTIPGIQAPLPHAGPDAVFGNLHGEPVRSCPISGLLVFPASTRHSVSGSQVVAAYRSVSATITAAQPSDPPVLSALRIFSEYAQTAKAGADGDDMLNGHPEPPTRGVTPPTVHNNGAGVLCVNYTAWA